MPRKTSIRKVLPKNKFKHDILWKFQSLWVRLFSFTVLRGSEAGNWLVVMVSANMWQAVCRRRAHFFPVMPLITSDAREIFLLFSFSWARATASALSHFFFWPSLILKGQRYGNDLDNPSEINTILRELIVPLLKGDNVFSLNTEKVCS